MLARIYRKIIQILLQQLLIIFHMSIKIQYKGKVHKLAPGLKTVEEILNDIKVRYPVPFKNGIVLGYSNSDQLAALTSNNVLQELLKKQGPGTSLRLRVFDAKDFKSGAPVEQTDTHLRKSSKDESSVFEVVDISLPPEEVKVVEQVPEVKVGQKKPEQVVPSKYSSPPPAVQQKPAKVEVAEVLIPDNAFCKKQTKKEADRAPSQQKNQKYYKCFQCSQWLSSRGCQICLGEGKITESHPLIGLIDEIITERTKKVVQKLLPTLLQQSKPHTNNIEAPVVKKPEAEQKPKDVAPYSRKSITDFSFSFDEPPQNKIKCTYSQQFLWNLKITNNGRSAWPRKVYIYRISNGKHEDIYQFPGVMPGQKVNLAIGFKSTKNNAVDLYQLRLGYVDLYDGVLFFGPKFGFEVDTKVEPVVQKLKDTTSDLRENIIAAVKFVPNQRHSISYLVDRINQLGIGKEVSTEVLADIIASLQ